MNPRVIFAIAVLLVVAIASKLAISRNFSQSPSRQGLVITLQEDNQRLQQELDTLSAQYRELKQQHAKLLQENQVLSTNSRADAVGQASRHEQAVAALKTEHLRQNNSLRQQYESRYDEQQKTIENLTRNTNMFMLLAQNATAHLTEINRLLAAKGIDLNELDPKIADIKAITERLRRMGNQPSVSLDDIKKHYEDAQ